MVKPFIAFTLIAAVLHLSPTATGAEAESADTEVTNMLIFGNSACHGLIEHLPRMYAADGQKLRVRCLRAHAGAFTHAVEAIESGQATGDPLPKEMPDGKRPSDYGYVALETDYDARVFLLDEIRAQGSFERIAICYVATNQVARDFYASLGFQETGLS